jgi:hypothetical protein
MTLLSQATRFLYFTSFFQIINHPENAALSFQSKSRFKSLLMIIHKFFHPVTSGESKNCIRTTRVVLVQSNFDSMLIRPSAFESLKWIFWMKKDTPALRQENLKVLVCLLTMYRLPPSAITNNRKIYTKEWLGLWSKRLADYVLHLHLWTLKKYLIDNSMNYWLYFLRQPRGFT